MFMKKGKTQWIRVSAYRLYNTSYPLLVKVTKKPSSLIMLLGARGSRLKIHQHFHCLMPVTCSWWNQNMFDDYAF